MRAKLIAVGVTIAALLVGAVCSQAALQNSVQVKVNFKKAGGPGSIELQLLNFDGNPFPTGKAPSDSAVENVVLGGGIVPQPVRELAIQSQSIKYNSRAVKYCTIVASDGTRDIPTNARGNNDSSFLAPRPNVTNSAEVLKNCPLSSLVGQGNFTAVVGIPGQKYDPTQAGAITGKVYLYNYRPRAGDQAALVAFLQSDKPVAKANQYMYVGVSKSGVIDTIVPNRSELPPTIASVLPDGSLSMTSMHIKLAAKGSKPLFTVKSFQKLDVYGQLIRTDN